MPLLFLAFSNCKKEVSNSVEPKIVVSAPAVNKPIDVFGCDDTTFFQSSEDLEQLVYLHDCYLCTATKEVPGLGSIPWTANIFVYIVENKLQFQIGTFQDSINWFIREEIFCAYVPIIAGIHPVFDNYHYNQNPGSTFGGYARSFDDGDVADGYWTIDTTCTNFIEIAQLDLVDKELRGNFSFHLKMLTQGQNGTLYSERINFIDGKFAARINGL